MCQTFLFYHLCGHIHSKKIWRCSKETERQLGLANMDQIAPRYPIQDTFTKTGLCLDCDGEETFLKPTLCEICEKTGIISDWLKNDPAMRFEIVKEWLRMKAAERGEGRESSTLAEGSSSPRTPSRKVSLSGTQVTDLEIFDNVSPEHFSPLSPETPTKLKPVSIEIGVCLEPRLAAHEVMTPILADYLSKAESFEPDVAVVEQKLEKRSQDAQQDAESTDDLKARAAGIHMKNQALLTSFSLQDCHISLVDDVEEGQQGRED